MQPENPEAVQDRLCRQAVRVLSARLHMAHECNASNHTVCALRLLAFDLVGAIKNGGLSFARGLEKVERP